MREFERVPAADDLRIARVTYEFLRRVPTGELGVEAEVARDGRRVRLLEGVLTADGEPVVRARALLILPARAASTPDVAPPPGPETGTESSFQFPHRPMFAPDAIEIRYLSGGFGGHGPATAWFRMRAPIVDSEEPSPLERLAAAADFGNGISATHSWSDYLFINPDLTLYVDREPVGEWLCLDSRTRIADGGAGISESAIFDRRGLVGRAIQALLVAPR
jgi:hypothetical protein